MAGGGGAADDRTACVGAADAARPSGCSPPRSGCCPGASTVRCAPSASVGGTPRFIARGEGAWLEDADGNRYVDLVLSWGPLILGHAHPEVLAAVVEAAGRGTTFGAPTELEVRLAERVVATFPSLEMVRFVSSGTEAAMSAVRLARAATGRPGHRQVRRLLPRPRRCPARRRPARASPRSGCPIRPA